MTSSCPCIWDDKFTLRRRVLVIGFAVRRFPCAEDRRDIVIPYRFPPYRPCHASAFRAPFCHVERSRNISHKLKTEGKSPPFFSDYLSTFWNVPFGPELFLSFELVTVKKLRSFEILKFTVNSTMPPIKETSNE